MERKLYKSLFRPENQVNWPCPRCQAGFLRIIKGTFVSSELTDSKNAHERYDWSHDWVELVYSCTFVCQNDQCEEKVASSGIGFPECDVVEDEQGRPEQKYFAYYKPKHFTPHLKLIKVPKKTPDSVTQALNESFELFFVSPSACANQVRSAVESLLTELNVKKSSLNRQKKKMMRLNLHQRIGLLPKKYDEYKELFYAVKWLGNAGSHEGTDLEANDVLDAYEIMEHLLEEIYSQRSARLKGIAKKVNKNKGPK